MKKNIIHFLANCLLLLIGLSMILPFIYMVVTSFKVTYSEYKFSFNINELTLSNYINILQNTNFIKYFFNTTLISISGVILNVVFSSLAAYAFAKMEFPGNKLTFSILVSTLILPSQVVMTPLYLIMRSLGWINTYKALILPLPSAFGILIMRQSILEIPEELIESAKIDGANDFQVFLKIIIPLIKSSILSLTLFTFIGAWNEFIWPLIMTTNDDVRTLTVGLANMRAQYHVNYGQLMAGTTLTFLPSFIIYLFLFSKFDKGVLFSGLKG